jgi:hypothetical protein
MSQAQAPSRLFAAPRRIAIVKYAMAQSELSVGLSMLPIASVAVVGGAASATAGAVAVAPSVLLAGGAVLTVKAVESTARGTVYVLERASDGARLSVEVVGSSVAVAGLAVGATVTASVIGTGVVLSAAGNAIAFIPNELGKALLHNERITR